MKVLVLGAGLVVAFAAIFAAGVYKVRTARAGKQA
jgi:hypothetical protein